MKTTCICTFIASLSLVGLTGPLVMKSCSQDPKDRLDAPLETSQTGVVSNRPKKATSIKLTADEANALVQKATMKMGLDLDFVREIDPGIASILARAPGVLSLNGLKQIDFDTAVALTTNTNRAIRLNGITELSPSVAGVLAKMTFLELNQLQPSVEVLEALSPFNGILKLHAIQELDAPSAAHLAKNGISLSLDGIKSMTPDVARELARSKAKISLNQLEKVSDEAAEEISKHQGGLQMSSLRSLHSVQLAKTLAQNQSGAELLRLEDTSIECLQVLVGGSSRVSLGLTQLSDEQSRVLSECTTDLTLPRIHKLSTTQIENLLRVRRKLVLPGLRELSNVDLAKRLSDNSPRMLDLRQLESIDEDIARAISKNSRNGYILLLNSIQSLDAPTAKVLAGHQGNLQLRGLREMNDEIAEAFSERTKLLLLSKTIQLSDHARQMLTSNQKITFK